jgi:hypothetical protein
MQAMGVDGDALAESEDTGRERRVWPRVSATAIQNVKARLAAGGDVTLKDVSRTGARLESTRRMLPNSSISLTLVTPDTCVVMTGLIVRSRIVRLADGLGYDVAVSFSQLLQHLPEIPAADPEATSARADAAPVAEARVPVPSEAALPPSPDVPDVATLRVTADIESSETLRYLFDENGW